MECCLFFLVFLWFILSGKSWWVIMFWVMGGVCAVLVFAALLQREKRKEIDEEFEGIEKREKMHDALHEE